MRELSAESQKDSFLKRPLSSWLRLDGWILVAIVIVAAAAVTRLWDLGSRSYNHDEAIHAWESWKLYTGQGYVHSPIYHGPFLYHVTALIYFLFGHSDYTGRLSAAIFSIATVIIVFFLRRWLGRRGTLVAAALVVISPALLYYGRFIRHDVYSVFFTLLMFLGILRYLERREDKYLYLVVLGQALYFSNMETAFIQTFVFWTFLAVLFVRQAIPMLKQGKGIRSLRTLPAFDLLIVMGTFVLPLASPLGIKAAGVLLNDARFDPINYNYEGIIRSGAIWLVFLAASIAIGLRWDWKRWLVSAGIFYAIYIVLFTAFFTNGQGIATGQVGSLGYWLSQQTVKRGGQPWHYYLILLPLYEYLPLFFAIVGGIFYLSRRSSDPAPEQGPDEAQTLPRAPVVPMLIWWSFFNLVIFSWGGEKMPWLLTHLTLPLILLTGWFSDHLFAADWREFGRRGAGWVGLLMPLAVVAIVGALSPSARPFTGTTTVALNATMKWLSAFALLLIVGVPLTYYTGELGWRKTCRVALVVVFVFLAAFTVHNSWMAVYKNGDVAVETLIYAQGTPDDPLVMRELEYMSRRLTGGEKDLKVAYDDESSWPFVWYFRDWPNAQFMGKSPSGPVDAAVVLVDSSNEAAYKPFLGNRYYRRQYRLIWWPIEDYKTLTPAKIWSNLTNPQTRKSLWDIIMYRKYDAQLSAWPLVKTFAMYVRKDIASQLWDYGPESVGPASEPAVDDYMTRYRVLSARRAIGAPGQGLGQMGEPKGVTVDRAGRIYVAEARNHRIQVFDANGAPVATWGTNGAAAGQFQEPWGVAVAPDGTVYVADTWNHRIQKLDRDGKPITSWGTYGQTGGKAGAPGTQFYGPRGIAVDPQGNLWVTDTGNKRVIKFDPNGTVLGQWGTAGAMDGQFLEPVGIAVDSQGNVYVADTWNRRVQVFDAEFRYLRQWPIEGWEGQSGVNKPYLAVDATGNVYVTDPESSRVIKFSGEGKVLAVWGKRGEDLTSLNLPTGIAVDGQGRVLVADSANNRIVEFEPVQ